MLAASQALLYLISSVLFYPVIISLLVLFVLVLFEAGKTLGEWFKRRRLPVNNITWESCPSLLPKGVSEYFIELEDTLKKHGKNEAVVEVLLQNWEEKLHKELDRLRVLVRISPSLGLMGTLIPMSTGLAALSKGNLDKLVSSLIIALTTTVVGLAVAVIAYVLGTVRQRWVERDIRIMEFYTEMRFEKESEVS